MNINGPIIIVEDDEEDTLILDEVFEELQLMNRILYFKNGEEAYNFLIEVQEEPFIIFSDINMPKVNGIELRNKILNNEALKKKSIPFVFFTTSNSNDHKYEAYSRSLHGYFIKPPSHQELLAIIKTSIEYFKIEETAVVSDKNHLH